MIGLNDDQGRESYSLYTWESGGRDEVELRSDGEGGHDRALGCVVMGWRCF
jgi:hypothetical protein